MEDKKINWYLIDIIAKYHTAPLQTISYLIAYGTEIIGIISALFFVGHYIKIDGTQDGFHRYIPSDSYADGLLYTILVILFFISFLLLCITYLKSNVGMKKVLMIIGMSVFIIGVLFMAGLEILSSLSIYISIYAFAGIYFWTMLFSALLPVILVIMDCNLRIYGKKWLFSFIRTLLVIPMLLSAFEGDINGETILTIIIFVILPISVYVYYGVKFMCPYCKKGYALKKISSSVVGERDISIKKQERTVQYNNFNQEIAHSVTDRYVPGTETTYRLDYVCRYCSSMCRKRKIQKTINE